VGLAIFIAALVFLTSTGRKVTAKIWRLFIRTALGALAIYFLNLFGQAFDFYIPVNPITAIVVGVLGLPGLASLVVIKLWILS
jgi:inhibitor of the pro-sigma K processing machinery